MTTRKKGSVIGFDPLAWMKDPSPESGVGSLESKAQTSLGAGVLTPDPGPRTPDTPGAVQLGELLTIEQVAAVHAELGRHLHAGTVVLEGGTVKRVDAAGLQLLTAFVRAAESRGKPVQWRSASAAVRDGARHLGLSAALGLG